LSRARSPLAGRDSALRRALTPARPPPSIVLVVTPMAAMGCSLITGLPAHIDLDPHIVCEEGGCACVAGFDDCDAIPDNGCEIELDRASEHCGSCGHDCRGGDCVEGRCGPAQLASTVASDIAFRGSAILVAGAYETASAGLSPFLRVPQAESDPPVADPLGFAGRSGFSVFDGSIATYAVVSSLDGDGWSLLRIPAGGGAGGEVWSDSVFVGGWIPGVTAGYVYTVDTEFYSVCRASIAEPGAPLDCVNSPPFLSAAGGHRAYWSNSNDILSWDDASPEPEVAVPAEDLGQVEGMAVHGERLFYLERFGPCGEDPLCERLFMVPVPGGTPVQIATIPLEKEPLLGFPPALGADDTHVYVATGQTRGSLWRAPIGEVASEPEEIATKCYVANARILLDEEAIYWTDGSGIHRLTKPEK